MKRRSALEDADAPCSLRTTTKAAHLAFWSCNVYGVIKLSARIVHRRMLRQLIISVEAGPSLSIHTISTKCHCRSKVPPRLHSTAVHTRYRLHLHKGLHSCWPLLPMLRPSKLVTVD